MRVPRIRPLIPKALSVQLMILFLNFLFLWDCHVFKIYSSSNLLYLSNKLPISLSSRGGKVSTSTNCCVSDFNLVFFHCSLVCSEKVRCMCATYWQGLENLIDFHLIEFRVVFITVSWRIVLITQAFGKSSFAKRKHKKQLCNFKIVLVAWKAVVE